MLTIYISLLELNIILSREAEFLCRNIPKGNRKISVTWNVRNRNEDGRWMVLKREGESGVRLASFYFWRQIYSQARVISIDTRKTRTLEDHRLK